MGSCVYMYIVVIIFWIKMYLKNYFYENMKYVYLNFNIMNMCFFVVIGSCYDYFFFDIFVIFKVNNLYRFLVGWWEGVVINFFSFDFIVGFFIFIFISYICF